jgi:hypothetical protein
LLLSRERGREYFPELDFSKYSTWIAVFKEMPPCQPRTEFTRYSRVQRGVAGRERFKLGGLERLFVF